MRGSAMTHTSLAQLRRNLALVIGNAGDAALGRGARPPRPRREQRRPQRRHAGRQGRGRLGQATALAAADRDGIRPAPPDPSAPVRS